MSVRIYQLSKQTGLSNGELIELLKSRGYLVTSASSTIDNISAESLVEEFTKKPEPEAPKPEENHEVAGEGAKTETLMPEEPPPPRRKPILPPGFVKSQEEVEKERRERLASR